MGYRNYGDRVAREVSGRIAMPVATMTALKAMKKGERVAGMRAVVNADGARWRWSDTSVLTGDDLLVSNPTDAPATGRWLRQVGGMVIKIPITFATVDATVLMTMQAGQLFRLDEPFWMATIDWAGGAASTIGISSSNKGSLTTKGDVLGGAAGSAAAALTAAGSPNMGTIGAGYDTLAKRRVIWKPTETFRHDRITDAFTSGAGFACLSGNLLANDGA